MFLKVVFIFLVLKATLMNTHVKYVAKSFFCKQSLHHHIIALHTTKKEHSCHVCNKSYYFKQRLQLHLSTHKGIEHICAVCVKPFKSEYSLKRHNNVTHMTQYGTRQCLDLEHLAPLIWDMAFLNKSGDLPTQHLDIKYGING